MMKSKSPLDHFEFNFICGLFLIQIKGTAIYNLKCCSESNLHSNVNVIWFSLIQCMHSSSIVQFPKRQINKIWYFLPNYHFFSLLLKSGEHFHIPKRSFSKINGVGTNESFYHQMGYLWKASWREGRWDKKQFVLIFITIFSELWTFDKISCFW